MAHVVEVVLEPELGGVHADDDKPALPILLGPGTDVRQRPQPVHAGVRPDVEQDDAPAKRVRDQRLGVEPDALAVECRERASDWARGRHRYRCERNVARTSWQSSCGCSQAAKWPPRSCWL